MYSETVVKNDVQKLGMIKKMATEIKNENNAVLWQTFVCSQSLNIFYPLHQSSAQESQFTNK